MASEISGEEVEKERTTASAVTSPASWSKRNSDSRVATRRGQRISTAVRAHPADGKNAALGPGELTPAGSLPRAPRSPSRPSLSLGSLSARSVAVRIYTLRI